ncbi:NHL domain-containing protein [Actinidia rufa]|uniref:NHL domain-containing protein n=1 Tax=Actinidia rufa TaxID=165716 RepID=A0A7J0EP91_9ERIC|nr:NHL domain-containing protein [Actinidia rufa]
MASVFSLFPALFLLFNLHVRAELVLEEGYSVSTVLDGNKLEINPHSILPLFGASNLVLLDSEHSAFFTVSFDAESAIKPLSGNGIGFSDGDLATATFSKPKSFAVDLSGNVYVADKGNRAVRKISKSGVTTIAGGSKTEGKTDGPGQNASFSTDFELAFSPERCALMICDHGNKLVRQINLKSQDCARGSHSELGVSPWVWALALGVSCFLGMIIGFAVRPYVTRYEGSDPLHFKETWKRYPIIQGTQLLTLYFDIRNAIVSSTPYTLLRSFIMLSLSQLSLMFRINNTVEPRISHKKSVSLLDSGLLGTKEMAKSQMYDEQLKDLITFDGRVESPDHADIISSQMYDEQLKDLIAFNGHVESPDHADIISSQMYDEQLKDLIAFDGHVESPDHADIICSEQDDYREGFSSEGNQMIDSMIKASIMGFEGQVQKAPLEEPLVTSSGLVKRR